MSNEKQWPDLIKAGLKVGDKLDGIFGRLVVTHINPASDYPILCESERKDVFGTYFDKYGFVSETTVRPSIWFPSDTEWFTPPATRPEPDHLKEFYTGRKVWVRDDSKSDFRKKIAAMYLPSPKNRFGCFTLCDNQETAKDIFFWKEVSYTRPEGAEDHE